MKIRLLSTFLALTLTILACSIPGLDLSGADTPTPAPATEPVPTLTPTLDVPPLTLDQLKNAEYRTAFYPGETRIIKLTDGKYQQSDDPTSPDFASVTLGEHVAFGDLDGDRVPDAVVSLAENYGGTGVFVSLAAVLNKGGLPKHAASATVDDRPIIDSLSIENGEIYMEGTIHSFQDPMCCPTFKVTESFRLSGNALVLTRFTSFTPTGDERVIDINLPLDGWEVADKMSVSGGFTIGPFENTLAYHIYDRESKEISSGPIMVDSDGMGAPGTFNVTIDLNALNYHGPILLTISENSMADGSLLVLDSVQLVVK